MAENRENLSLCQIKSFFFKEKAPSNLLLFSKFDGA
jgi:hypothetical protein